MSNYVFVKEPLCILGQENTNLGRNYNCIVFSLRVPHYDIEPFQLTGSRIIVSSLLGDFAGRKFRQSEVGTVTDVLRSGDYSENIRIQEVNRHLSIVFGKIDSEAFELLQPFSFYSADPNARGWLHNFSVHKQGTEASAAIPIRNIKGYEIHPDMKKRNLCNYWRCGWPPTEGYTEYITRRYQDFKKGGIVRDRTFISNDLLTVTTIIKRKASPFTEDDVARKSAKYGKPLRQTVIESRLSKKHALADEVRF